MLFRSVPYGPNYDDSLQEPLLLPTKIPNLLVNGSSGIAVGMATNIPPHNLGEVCDALVQLIENPSIDNKDLYKTIKGPDFPTAGIIYGTSGIRDAYEKGKGKFTVRARASIENVGKSERKQIVVTELPYQVNKAKLIESIADLVREKKVEGIRDLRDESDREGMRIVIETKTDATPEVILNQLYTNTQMQISYGVILLALVHNKPKIISLREALELFIQHRKEIVTRRTVFDLRKAEERAHILAGLVIALDHLDEVIALIRKAKDPATAKEGLQKKFSLTEIQATAILEMRLSRLTNLERDKIVNEYEEIKKLIAELQKILADERLVAKIVAKELGATKEEFADKRRTEIRSRLEEFSEEDLIEEEEMVITVTHAGYVKRNPASLYKSQKRGGKGKVGTGVKEEDFVTSMFVASTHAYLLVFSDRGRLYWLKVHEVPQAGRSAKGKPIVNLVNMNPGETVAAVLTVDEFVEGKYVFMATRRGIVKKTDLMQFANPRSNGILACTVEDGDKMIGVQLTDGKMQIFLASKNGQAIRFDEEEVRPMGRQAVGVYGMDLEKGDEVVSMEVITNEGTLLTATQNGYGKRTDTNEYRKQSRGGKGIMTINVTDKNGPAVGLSMVQDDDDVMLITDQGQLIRMHAKDISVIGRATQGVRLISLAQGEKLVSLAKIVPVAEEDGE